MRIHQERRGEFFVALRKESVDRNIYFIGRLLKCCVALRKESVDRNGGLMSVVRFASVALRKESVDRNLCFVALKAPEKRRSPQGERG